MFQYVNHTKLLPKQWIHHFNILFENWKSFISRIGKTSVEFSANVHLLIVGYSSINHQCQYQFNAKKRMKAKTVKFDFETYSFDLHLVHKEMLTNNAFH